MNLAFVFWHCLSSRTIVSVFMIVEFHYWFSVVLEICEHDGFPGYLGSLEICFHCFCAICHWLRHFMKGCSLSAKINGDFSLCSHTHNACVSVILLLWRPSIDLFDSTLSQSFSMCGLMVQACLSNSMPVFVLNAASLFY